jgi:hypothetical protein
MIRQACADDNDIVSEGFGFGHAGPFYSKLAMKLVNA